MLPFQRLDQKTIVEPSPILHQKEPLSVGLDIGRAVNQEEKRIHKQ